MVKLRSKQMTPYLYKRGDELTDLQNLIDVLNINSMETKR